jgi:hypothetical protein
MATLTLAGAERIAEAERDTAPGAEQVSAPAVEPDAVATASVARAALAASALAAKISRPSTL